MLALYIILGVVLFITLILISSISVCISIIDDLRITVRFWFLRFNIFPFEKKKPKENKPTDSEKQNYLKKLISENGFLGAVSELISIAKVILKKMGKTSKHIRVRKFFLWIVAASEDPSDTGVLYGSLCGIIFPALRAFQSLLKWNDRKTKVSVTSDFLREKPDFALECKLKLRVYYIVVLGLGVLFELVKRKINMSNYKNN